VGADNFDRLFRGIRFDDVDDILFAYAADEYRTLEIEPTSLCTSRSCVWYLVARNKRRDGVAETVGAGT
jgi:hypothetical protein